MDTYTLRIDTCSVLIEIKTDTMAACNKTMNIRTDTMAALSVSMNKK